MGGVAQPVPDTPTVNIYGLAATAAQSPPNTIKGSQGGRGELSAIDWMVGGRDWRSLRTGVTPGEGQTQGQDRR